jgi:hypothetical protein
MMALGGPALVSAQEEAPIIIEIVGRITDGEHKLVGCSVVIHEGNEVVGTQVTDKGGRFGLAWEWTRSSRSCSAWKGTSPRAYW